MLSPFKMEQDGRNGQPAGRRSYMHSAVPPTALALGSLSAASAAIFPGNIPNIIPNIFRVSNGLPSPTTRQHSIRRIDEKSSSTQAAVGRPFSVVGRGLGIITLGRYTTCHKITFTFNCAPLSKIQCVLGKHTLSSACLAEHTLAEQRVLRTHLILLSNFCHV